MIYVVQENVFREENYDKIFYALKKLGLEYEVASLKGDGELHVETERKDVFALGSIRLARLASEKDWKPGSFFGGNHDYEVYSEHYGENLLNYDCKLFDIGEELDWGLNEIKFIRPSKDSKLVTGKLYTKTKWDDTINLLKERHNGSLPWATIQVNSPKTIYKEARCWIVDGKIITSSYYKFGSNVMYEEEVEPEGLNFAQSMVDLYQVADAFVMDICLTPEGWKIVEINCINCSGFYKGDLQKLLIALEDKFNPIE